MHYRINQIVRLKWLRVYKGGDNEWKKEKGMYNYRVWKMVWRKEWIIVVGSLTILKRRNCTPIHNDRSDESQNWWEKTISKNFKIDCCFFFGTFCLTFYFLNFYVIDTWCNLSCSKILDLNSHSWLRISPRNFLVPGASILSIKLRREIIFGQIIIRPL